MSEQRTTGYDSLSTLPPIDMDHLLRTVEARVNEGPVFVHVCGASAAGKSTISRGLATLLPEAQVFSMDSYLSEGLWDQTRTFNHVSPDPNRPYIAGISPDIWDMNLMEAHMATLRQGQEVSMPIFDETIKDRVGYRPFTPSRYVVVEGGHSFTDRFRQFADYGVLVEAPLHDRLTRKIVRTHAIYHLNDVDEVLQRYLTKDEPVRRFYEAEYHGLASQVVFNPANPQRDYAHLPTTLAISGGGTYHPLLPKKGTGPKNAGEAFGVVEETTGIYINYAVDGKLLVYLPIEDKTAELLSIHYDLGDGVHV